MARQWSRLEKDAHRLAMYERRMVCRKAGHSWTRWEQAGLFDTTQRRDCTVCKLIQTRKPQP